MDRRQWRHISHFRRRWHRFPWVRDRMRERCRGGRDRGLWVKRKSHWGVRGWMLRSILGRVSIFSCVLRLAFNVCFLWFVERSRVDVGRWRLTEIATGGRETGKRGWELDSSAIGWSCFEKSANEAIGWEGCGVEDPDSVVGEFRGISKFASDG